METHPLAAITVAVGTALTAVSGILAQTSTALSEEWQVLAVVSGVAMGTAAAVTLVWRVVRGSIHASSDTIDELMKENARLRRLLEQKEGT